MLKKWGETVFNYIRQLRSPTFFDFCACIGIIPIAYLHTNFKGIYLVFFSLFLMCYTLSKKSVREYHNKWLSLILLWSLMGVFLHSWVVNADSGAYKWINFQLMSEGFIYIFFSIMLLVTIIKFGKNYRLLFITLPIAFIPMYQKMVHCGQMSLMLAVLLGVIVYFMSKSRKRVIWFIIGIFGTLVIANYKWLLMKFECRPYVWIELLRQIYENFWFGTGYNKLLRPDNMVWVREIGTITCGWLFRHNDYLSIVAFLGFPIIIPIVGVIHKLIKRFKTSPKAIFIYAVLILCFFQITMFEADKALFIITILGYLHGEL